MMTRNCFAGLLMFAALASAGCVSQPVEPALIPPVSTAVTSKTDGKPGFRVRGDFSAPLNADTGWAAGVNAIAPVTVDQPFRLRFEVEPAGPAIQADALRLQYRSAGGQWSPVEAHDFPYPSRELEIDFADAPAGTLPEGWYKAAGEGGTLSIIENAGEKVMHAQAGAEALVGLYSPPWHLAEFSFAAEYLVPAGSPGQIGIVFGYVDAENHWRVLMDTRAGVIRVSRFTDGAEQLITEKSAGLIEGVWQDVEVSVEAGRLEVNFGDDALQFSAWVSDAVMPSDLGFVVPSQGRVHFRSFVIEGPPSSPPVSIVSASTYGDGDATLDLLPGATSPFARGAGVSLSGETPAWTTSGQHSEFEWPLVIRRFADKAVLSEDGDTFEFRISDGNDDPISGSAVASVRLVVPAFHLGGTFVETPGRIGPWQTENGDLYFIMEPTESDNLFMVVKSSDGGRSWRELDGDNRPATGDLESVDARLVNGDLHIIHQVSDAVMYHKFRTSGDPARPDTWAVTDELGTKVIARVQMATMAVRSDGSIVAFHLGDTVGYAIRSPEGIWSDEIVIGGNDGVFRLAGPQAVLGTNGEVHLAYYREDGTIWHRRLLRDGTLTEPHQLATGAGTTQESFGSVLPLVYIPQTDTTVIIYQRADGTLWERRVTAGQLPTPAVRVTAFPVARSVVDSQQPGADAVADGETVRVLFIGAEGGNIYSTHDADGWQPPTPEVENIDGGWVRGNVYVRPDGAKVYGYVYDAGSKGGAGFNRFAEKVLAAQ